MINGVPQDHIQDALKLQGDGHVQLFEIQLYPTGFMYLTSHPTVTWQGKKYMNWGVQLTGLGKTADEATNRPKFSIANFSYDDNDQPIRGVFSSLNAQNAIEGATVIRRKVRVENLANNVNIKEEKRWRVSRISSETPDLIVLELRNTLDGPRFTIPARKFVPPEFQQVKLS